MLRGPSAPLRRRSSLLLVAALLTSSPAFAQSAKDLARARTEFREAIALQTAGDWAGALAKLRSVGNVKLTPQVRFNIAVCEEHLGSLVAALGDFRLTQDEALDQKLDDLAKSAEQHGDAIAARVPKLTISRGKGAEAASIALDGVTLGATVLGTAMNVDPGPHTVTASIAGEEKFSQVVQLTEGQAQTVEVAVAASAPIAHTGEAPQPGRAIDGATSGAPERPPAGSDRGAGGGAKTAGWIALGAGGASTVAGVVFIVLRGGAISDLDAVCRDGHCPSSSQSTIDKGKLYTGLAEGTLVAGVAGLAIGSILLLGGHSDGVAATTGAAAQPSVALRSGAPGALAGASLTGQF